VGYCTTEIRILTIDDGISLMKRQFVVTDTVCRTEFGYKHICRQNGVPTKNCLSLHFPKNITCLSVGLLRIGQVFSVSSTVVYRWVTAISCCMSVVVVVVVIVVVIVDA
jgi:hypothetical protein